MSRGLGGFVSHGTSTWEEQLASRHEALTAADYNRTKAGLGSVNDAPDTESAKAAGVAAHYNSISDRHRTLSDGSDILHLRNLNNWIKSVLISKHLPKGRGKMGHAVLDLACGKGGDMLKFKVGGCAMYVGIDIAAQSVRDAVERYNGANGRPGMPYAATFMAGDFCAVSVAEQLPPDLWFALASCQFALHYSFASESRARALLQNAAARLAIGGTFVATVPDADVLVRRLRAADALTFGNSLYRVEFAGTHASKGFPASASPFGLAYRFTLKEAVDECEEYLVHLPTLRRLAAEQGLEMLYARNFTDFFAEECHVKAHAELLERMKVLPAGGVPLSEDEWEVAHTYMAIAFRKQAETASGASSAPSTPQLRRNPGNQRQSESDIIHLDGPALAAAATGAAKRPHPAGDGTNPPEEESRKRARSAASAAADPPPAGERRAKIEYTAATDDLFD